MMELEVTFNRRRFSSHVYHPGDEIIGLVQCRNNGRRSVFVATIEMIFQGKVFSAVTALRRRPNGARSKEEVHMDDIYLFRQSQRVFDGGVLLQPRSKQVIPFKFTLPYVTTLECQDDPKAYTSMRRYTSAQMLPPSYSPLNPWYWHASKSMQSKCYVRYELHTSIYGVRQTTLKHRIDFIKVNNLSSPRSTETGSRWDLSQFPLQICPNRRIQVRPGRDGSGTVVTPQHRRAKRMQLLFRSPKPDDVSLKFQAHLHAAASLSPINITMLAFSVIAEGIGAGMAQEPKLILTWLDVTLERIEHVTTTTNGSVAYTYTTTGHAARLFLNKKLRQKLPLDGRPVYVTPFLRLGTSAMHPKRLVPDFVLPNVKVEHRIKAKAKVLHEQSGRVFALVNEAPFVVRSEYQCMRSRDSSISSLDSLPSSRPSSCTARSEMLSAELPSSYHLCELSTGANVAELEGEGQQIYELAD